MIKELSAKIEDELNNLDLPTDLPNLYDPISYTLENGGKRLRPLLLMISSRIFGGNDEDSIHQALAVEIFHNFTLVHDDIMDNAPLRRGKESVYKKWDSNTAILSGDVMYSLSFAELSKCNPETLPAILECFIDTGIKVCEGQQMDMDFEMRDDVVLDEYIKMIGMKTAVLMAGSLKIGALAAGGSISDSDSMYEYGMKAGTAFQLIDDYLDAFGDPEKFGKKVGGDIIARKKTYLYLNTLEYLEEEDKKEFEKVFNSDTLSDDYKVNQVKDFFKKTGAHDRIRERANALLFEAKEILDNIKGDEKAKEELINLTLQLTNREK